MSWVCCALVPMYIMYIAATAAPARVVTLDEALESVRRNNITWQSLAEFANQAQAGQDIGWGLLFPKVQVQGQWLHLGERHTPDLSSLTTLIGGLMAMNPATAAQMGGGGSLSDVFDNMVPASNTLSAAFNVVIPVLNAPAIFMIRGANDRYQAALQKIGYGREQLLFSVAKAYYGLVTLQSLLEVANHSIASAQAHYKQNSVRQALDSATLLEVKRAELEVVKAQSQKAKLAASYGKAQAAFAYLTGLNGSFTVVEPRLALPAGDRALEDWVQVAKSERRDLVAARLDEMAAEHEANQGLAQYLPSVNLVGQGKLDNAEKQRFDDDPFSWTVLATATVDVWDGGIKAAQYDLAKSKLVQARLATEDLRRQIESSVTAAKQALDDARAARDLAEKQLEVAHTTEGLTQSSEQAGVVTNLEVIDANTIVFASEAQALSARLDESMAVLDLVSATGGSVPTGSGAAPPAGEVTAKASAD